jgi:RNA-directed DNA polymerase
VKTRIRQLTRRNRGVSLDQMVRELNQYLLGWLGYFRLAACKAHLQRLDEWIRRKLRCVKLKHCKRAKTIVQFLTRHGVPEWNAWRMAASGKGWWRKASTPQAHMAMSLPWFTKLGLLNLTTRYVALQH